MISANDLIAKFQYALDNKWGYIWGTAGVKWTKAKQEQLDQTTDSDRANGRKYGSKWIGHYVADCSGLFTWAFKQLGSTMYHGSNTMFLKWCEHKGELKKGARTDGATLKPGTAVFVWNGKTYSHVGLFIGDGTVIEAKGTVAGVTTSKVTDTKWTHWGELKDVDFSGKPQPEPEPEPKPAKGTAKVTGTRVALRTDPCLNANLILRVNTGETVKIEQPPPSEWEYVSYNGKKGWMMKKYLQEG